MFASDFGIFTDIIFDKLMDIYLLLPLLVSFLVTVVLVPPTIKLARKYKLLDDPKKHKHPAIIHKKPVPRAGGVPIFIAVLFSAVLFIPLSFQNIIILISGFIAVVVGVLDDKYDLSPYFRFGTNILCASAVVAGGVSIPFITNPFGGIIHFDEIIILTFGQAAVNAGQILAIVWIVWVMNMLNWSKGVDGQMPGIAAISAIIIGIASLRFVPIELINTETAQFSFIVAGAALGFLVFNFYPAKIFPGYSATILGFLLGVLSITSGVKLATAVLVMGVPTVDAIFTIIRRIISKKSPFWHDKGHLHHLLLDYGLGHRRIAVFYWSMSLILGLVAISASSRGKVFAIILLIVLFSGLFFMLRFITKKEQDYV